MSTAQDVLAQGLIKAFSAVVPEKKPRNVLVAGGQTFSLEDLRAHADREAMQGRRVGDLMHALIDGVDTEKLERELREAKQEVVDLRSDMKWTIEQLAKLRMGASLTGDNEKLLAEVIEALKASLT